MTMSQKIQLTHGVKKDFTAGNNAGEARHSPNPDRFALGENSNSILFGPGGIDSARPDFMELVTGLKEHQLRTMASEGYFPPPVKRKFRIGETVRGAFQCLMARMERKTEMPTYGSMEAAEGAGICSKKFLQTLKNGGCPGFHSNGRVDLGLLIPGIEAWLSGDNQRDKLELQREGVSSWGVLREKYQAKNEMLKHDELDGKLMDRETSEQIGLAAQTVYFSMLDRLGVDFPGRLAGRTAAEIKKEVDKALLNIRRSVEKEFESRRKSAAQQLEALRKQDELVKIS